jgi:hypothetical protein
MSKPIFKTDHIDTMGNGIEQRMVQPDSQG